MRDGRRVNPGVDRGDGGLFYKVEGKRVSGRGMEDGTRMVG